MKKLVLMTFALVTLGLLLVPGAGLADEAREHEQRSNEDHVIVNEAPSKIDSEKKVEYFSDEWFAGPLGEMEEGDTCSGWCNNSICECTGSFDCCYAACRRCFEIVNEM